MSVVRIIVQPAGLRPAALAEKTSKFVAKLQHWLDWTAVILTKSAELLVALINPVALIALVLGLWRLTADLGWTGAFLISDGLFSHWQVWIALALVLKVTTTLLATWMHTPNNSEETSAPF